MILGANTIINDKHETELNIIGWSGIRTTSTALDTAPSVISRYRCPNQYQPYSLPSSPVPHLKGISYQLVGSHSFFRSLSISVSLVSIYICPFLFLRVILCFRGCLSSLFYVLYPQNLQSFLFCCNISFITRFKFPIQTFYKIQKDFNNIDFSLFTLDICFGHNNLFIYIIIPKCACVFVPVLFENG